jgi:hypothetical protein
MQDSNSTPMFFDATAALEAGETVDPERWLKIYKLEYESLTTSHKIVLLGEVCGVAMDRESWRLLDESTRKGLGFFESVPYGDKAMLHYYVEFLTGASVAANNRGDLDAARTLLQRAAEASPDSAYLSFWRMALFYHLADRFEESVDAIEKCVKCCPYKRFASDDFEQINSLFDASFAALHDKKIAVNSLRGRIINSWNSFTANWMKYDKHNPILLQRMDNNLIVMNEKKCFVATACCTGSHDHYIEKLHLFRESILRKFTAGRQVIGFYESVSPPIARVISCNKILQLLTRVGIVFPIFVIASISNSILSASKLYLRAKTASRKDF